MKASLSLAAFVLAASIPAVNAQSGLVANQDTGRTEASIKQQQILRIEAEIATLQAELAALRGETASANDLITEPVPIVPDATPTQPAPALSSGKTYTVVAGDGLMKIARKTNCRAADIASVNGMAMNDIIRPGQVLKLPTSATVAATPADSPSVPPKASVVEEAPKPRTYKIKEGETYYSISRRMKIPLDELMAANPKAPANRLYTGRVINLPVKGQVPAPAAAPAPAPAPTPAPAPAADTTLETASTPEPASDTPPAPAPAEEPRKKIIAVSVDEEISYGDFARKYGTNTDRLNSLNDLSLTRATILAKGSELYVPARSSAGN